MTQPLTRARDTRYNAWRRESFSPLRGEKVPKADEGCVIRNAEERVFAARNDRPYPICTVSIETDPPSIPSASTSRWFCEHQWLSVLGCRLQTENRELRTENHGV